MSAIPILKRALILGGVFAAALAVVGSVVGYLVADGTGVLSALIGGSVFAADDQGAGPPSPSD